MTEIEKNEVKWTPTDTGALLDVDALQKYYAKKGERGGGALGAKGRGGGLAWGRAAAAAAAAAAYRQAGIRGAL